MLRPIAEDLQHFRTRATLSPFNSPATKLKKDELFKFLSNIRNSVIITNKVHILLNNLLQQNQSLGIYRPMALSTKLSKSGSDCYRYYHARLQVFSMVRRVSFIKQCCCSQRKVLTNTAGIHKACIWYQ